MIGKSVTRWIEWRRIIATHWGTMPGTITTFDWPCITTIMTRCGRCKRAITRNCPSLSTKHKYATAMVTTYVRGKKVYWRGHEDVGWKQARRDPPPVPNNGQPVRVFYNHNMDHVYRYNWMHACACIDRNDCYHWHIHTCSKWYKTFRTSGCVLDGIRYTGADNRKLNDDDRAKRFLKYLQVCCNLHRGHDVTYIVKHWFRHFKSCRSVK